MRTLVVSVKSGGALKTASMKIATYKIRAAYKQRNVIVFSYKDYLSFWNVKIVLL